MQQLHKHKRNVTGIPPAHAQRVYRVVLHLFTGSFAIIGKLLALGSWYLVGIFLLQDLAGAPFCEILRELLLINLAGTYFSLKRGAWSIKKRGRSLPLREKNGIN